ncbi:hypothetical protein GZ77_06570 [Endozoicomonas montiporae]|uniref:Uncharacterized protein n=2 Tax=Endozoicomonas montiporae TaxID=1027273 RepID=A0A081NCE0_9GAMM|nr:hypothetical protein GZ77_06570 [Endozoicomonas montiporae]
MRFNFYRDGLLIIMKSPSRTIRYLTYKLRCFLSVFFLTVCALSFSTYSASDGDTPDTTSSPKNTTTHLPSNSTTTIVPTTSVSRTNPCSQITSNPEAQKSCNIFFNNPIASGISSFATAVVVRDVEELASAFKNADPKGSIIVLTPGNYNLAKKLEPGQRIALVGIKTGETRPTVSMNLALLERSDWALVNLLEKRGASAGFYSAFINWETLSDKESSNHSTIFGNNYPGEIRFYGNIFTHGSKDSHIGEFIYLRNDEAKTQKIVIDGNRFNTSNLHASAVLSEGPTSEDRHEIIIANNTLTSSNGADNKSQNAFYLINHNKFTIEKNTSLTRQANASIKIELPNEPGLQGSIKNNTADTGALVKFRRIEIDVQKDAKDNYKIAGRLTLSGNDYFDVYYDDEKRDYIVFTEGKKIPDSFLPARVSPSPTPAASVLVSPSAYTTTAAAKQAITSDSIQPSPTAIPATPSVTPTSDPTIICDHIQSSTEFGSNEIDACKAFLENKTASAGHTFSMAVVVSNAKELDDAVTGKFPSSSAKTSKLIVLKSGTYQLTRTLYITDKIALVGTVEDGEYPVIEIDAGNFKSNKNSLAHLYHDSTVVESGFYSHHIHWNTTNHKGTTLQLFMGAIDSQSYEGELRIYENKFSEARPGLTSHYILLLNAIGGAVIENNWFGTDYLTYTAVLVACSSAICRAKKPGLEVLDNHFHSDVPITPIINNLLYSIIVRGYMRYGIIGNRQETKEAAGNIYITDHKNEKNIDGYVLNNIAHKDAPELQRRILFRSYHSPKESVKITGKLHVAGNDYYTFKEFGLPSDHVGYRPGKQLASSRIASSQTTAATPSPGATSSTVKAAPSTHVSSDVSVGSITPARLLVSVTASVSPAPAKTKPCNDIRTHTTAFAACKAFLENKKASGPVSDNKFSHAILVNNSTELIDAVNKTTGDDGSAIHGRIVLLNPGTYELSKALSATHRTAMIGLKDEDDRLPVIKPAGDFTGSYNKDRSLLTLNTISNPRDTGFYSWNLEWKTAVPAGSHYYNFDAHVYAISYNGDIRIYQNRFSHGYSSWNRYAATVLLGNAGHKYYFGHNTCDDTSSLGSVLDSSAINSQAEIEIESNEFKTSGEAEFEQSLYSNAIYLNDYQRLKINDNIQKDKYALGNIKIKFFNNQQIINASIQGNKAHKDTPREGRTIKLEHDKSSFKDDDNLLLLGYVSVTRNDYYELEILGLADKNYRYTPGLKVSASASAALTRFTPPVTPSASFDGAKLSPTPSRSVLTTATVNSYGTPMPSPTGKIRSASSSSAPTQLTQPLPESTQGMTTRPLSAGKTSSTQPVKSLIASTQVPAATSTSVSSTPPVINSPCDQLTRSETLVCQKLTDDLQKLEIQTTFSEAVMVKNSQELINEITTTSESGKVILLHAGSYALDEPLHILKTVALVGIGNAVVKPSANYPAEAGALVLLDDAGTGHGFFTRDMTWDISAFGDSQGDPLSTAVKAVNYEGKLLMSGNDFQYHANRENEKAPSHYIEIQNSSGDVLISGNNFFSGGLQKAPIYASCQGCRTDDQTIGIFSNQFTDSNDGESALTAIDVRHYKTLNVHGNVQDTESASAGINIELPNHTDAINAIIKDNIAIGTSDETRRTIDLTVARLANEAARIDGTVEVSNNRCFSVNHNGIPSHVLGLIQGSCPISPTARAHIGEQSSSGISAGEGVGYTVAAAFGTYTILLLSSGAYSRLSLPGHEYVYKKIFLRLAGPVLWLYSNTFGSKSYKPQNNEENELKILYKAPRGKVFTDDEGKTDDRVPLTSEESDF